MIDGVLDQRQELPATRRPEAQRIAADLETAVRQERIAREQPIPLGSAEEVEIRAVALHAVERLVEGCRGRGLPLCAHELDHRLWDRGQSPEIKAVPRHRTRCTFY